MTKKEFIDRWEAIKVMAEPHLNEAEELSKRLHNKHAILNDLTDQKFSNQHEAMGCNTCIHAVKDRLLKKRPCCTKEEVPHADKKVGEPGDCLNDETPMCQVYEQGEPKASSEPPIEALLKALEGLSEVKDSN